MSKEVEQRVVEMRFDNRQFESNVSTTMSTLDKLKQKLNFSGAGKGLDEVGSSAKKAGQSITPLGNAVETVQAKFSALQVIGVTALANITNSALNAGKRIVSALTIDPIRTGLEEYETQINAVQTILANTQSKGSTLEDVNAALDELNKYADQTIYNFTEMTRNIGTFTAAGVDLEKSVTSIKGIANLAAVSGSTSQQAATAMYQLSQALAAGRVSLMDWNSVVNAGMGGEVFQTALIRTAQVMGTGVDEAIKKYGTFRESLTKGQWLTAEVLTETLTQLSGAYTEADLIAQGYTKEQAKQIVELAETAVGAATDVKTFTQLVDTTKEAIQSGWTQSWEIIIGDFEQAKELWSGIAQIIGDFVQGVSDARNSLLESVFGSNWDKMTKQIEGAGISLDDFNTELEKTARAKVSNFDEIIAKSGSLANAFKDGSLSSELIVETLKRMGGETTTAGAATEDMTKKLAKFQKVVDEVWNGDYKNSDTGRIELLTKAGYDYAQVQDLVNKAADGHRLTLEDLGETQLKAIGYTDEEVKALRDLAKQAEQTGTPLNDLITNITRPSGRDLLWGSITNILNTVIGLLKAVGAAWNDAFADADFLYNLLDGFNKFTAALVPSEETIKNLTSTFKGLFAILDIIFTLINRTVGTVFNAFTSVLGKTDLGILDITASIGEAIVAFRDWLLEGESLAKVFESLGSGISAFITRIKELVDAFLNLPIVQNIVGNIRTGLVDLKDVGLDAIAGLQNGLATGLTSIPQMLMEIGKKLLTAIKNVLGIHSPSTEMAEVGSNAIEGFIQGISNGASKVFEVIKDIGSKCLEAVKAIPWGTIAAVGVSAGLLYLTKQMVDIVGNVTAPLAGIGDVLSGVGGILDEAAKPISKILNNVAKTVKSFNKILNAKAFAMRADAIKTLAIAIAILAVSLIALSRVPWDGILKGVVALGGLAVVIAVLSKAMASINVKSSVSFAGFTFALVGIALTLVTMSAALKQINSLDPNKMGQTLAGFATIIISLLGILAVYGKFVSGENAKNINKVGSMMRNLAITMLLMIAVIKLISGMSASELIKGGAAITAFVGITALLAKISSLTGKGLDKLGGTMIKLSVALGLMVIVIKLISGLSTEELLKGGAAITAFVGIIALLTLITNLVGTKDLAKLGSTLMAMSTAMGIMTIVIKLLAGMSVADIVKGEAALAGFTVILGLMTVITNLAGQNVKMAGTLLAMSISIGILAGIAVILSLINTEGLVKGIAAIAALGTIMAGLIAATYFAQDVKGNLVVMTVAFGILAAAVAALSFIEPAKLAGATAAMSILMAMFALVIKSSGNITSSIGPLIVMTTAIGLMAAALVVLSQMPIESTISSAASLSVLLISLAASLKLIGGMQSVSLKAVGALAIMAAVMAALALVLKLIGELNIETTLETVLSLSVLLGALTAATAILSVVGKGGGAAAALQGVLGLSGVVLVLGTLMAALGALVTYFPAMKQFVNEGIDLLNNIAYGIGSFIGNIVGGFMSGVTAGLPDIATNLSDFMTQLQPFITAVDGVKPTTIESAKNLAQMILIFTAADVVNGLTSWFTGGSSLTKFAEDLQPFGAAMAGFADEVKDIKPATVEAAANAGLTLANLAKNLPKEGGLLQNILGTHTDLTTFGTQLKSFGTAIAEFGDEVANLKPEAVEAAANAGMTLANLAKNIPKQNGALQNFLGEQDLGVFGSQLKEFGTAIAEFSSEVVNVNPTVVEAAANAGMALANLANNIPKQNGILQDFFGERDLGVFGSQLKTFGTGIADFAKELGTGIDAEVVTAATNAGMALANLATNLPRQNGILQNFFGEQDMGAFGTQLSTFGEKFADYSDYIKDIDPDVVADSTKAAESLVKLSDSLGNKDSIFNSKMSLEGFGKQIATFGEKLADYYEEIKDINTTTLISVIDSVSDIIDLGKKMDTFDSSAMSDFASNLKDLGNAGIDGFIKAFSDAKTEIQSAANSMVDNFIDAANARKKDLGSAFTTLISGIIDELDKKSDDFKTVANTFATKLSDGFQEKESTIKSIVKTISSNLIDGLKADYSSYKDAGSYVMSGFVDGMDSYSSKANSAARTLARNVLNSMKRELEIHSPSRVVRDEVGNMVVEGLAEGIEEDMTAEEIAAQKAQNITDAFQDEFDKLNVADQTADLKEQLEGISAFDGEIARQTERRNLALAKYNNIVKVYGEEALESQKAYNEYLQEEIDLRDKAAEKAQDAFEYSQSWIESNKEAGELSLVDELSAWRRVQSRYVEGTEERIKADEEILRLQEEIQQATDDYYNDLTSIQEEANQKRLEIEQNYADERVAIQEETDDKLAQLDQEYADKTKAINDQLAADIEDLNQQYKDAVQSRSDTLYGAYGLFDAVEKPEEVTGETLTQNLQGQLDAFKSWTEDINSLADRGIDDELLEELREMGPSSAAQIAALNAMTDEELDKYVALWREKRELADAQATFELEDLRVETKNQITQLREDAREELREYRKTWQDEVQAVNDDCDERLRELRKNYRNQLDELDTDTEKQLEELQNTWKESVLGLTQVTTTQFSVMTQGLIDTMGNRYQWSEAGANMIEGVLVGVLSHTSDLVDGVEYAMRKALDAANRTLGINSPSKEFMKIGRYSDEGFALGLRQYAGFISNSSEEVGKTALDSMRNSISMISDAINGDLDTQPTIRPVLDLSEIESKAGQLNTIFSRDRAMSINAGMVRRNPDDISDDAAGSGKKAGNTYQFTQNNYSPKALSRSEIYRQTKNQFSTFERKVGS